MPPSPPECIPFRSSHAPYFAMLGPGQNWRNLPVEEQKRAMGAAFLSGGGKSGFYRRLAWDKPSPTLLTSPCMPATALAHPTENRPLSIQEYKRIQTFPDYFKIAGNLVAQYRQLGNAVPVVFGKCIGLHLIQFYTNPSFFESFGCPEEGYSRYKHTSEHDWPQPPKKRRKKNI